MSRLKSMLGRGISTKKQNSSKYPNNENQIISENASPVEKFSRKVSGTNKLSPANTFQSERSTMPSVFKRPVSLLRGSSIAVPLNSNDFNKVGEGEMPELLIVGDTHTYNASFLAKSTTDFLKNALDKGINVTDNHFPLHCGVYCLKGEEPPIAAFATAFYNPRDGQTLYISLTVFPAVGHETDKNVMGIHRVAIFAEGIEGNLTYRLLDVVEDTNNSVERRGTARSILPSDSKFVTGDTKPEALSVSANTLEKFDRQPIVEKPIPPAKHFQRNPLIRASTFAPPTALTRGKSIAVPLSSKLFDSIGVGEMPELFIIGDTHTYNASFLSTNVTEYLKRAIDSGEDLVDNHLPLHCGVYCLVGEQPAIAAFATAFYSLKDRKSLCISLTVFAAKGHESDPKVLGVRRIAVFALGLEGNITHRLVDITDHDPDNAVQTQNTAREIVYRKSALEPISKEIYPILSSSGSGSADSPLRTPNRGLSKQDLISPAKSFQRTISSQPSVFERPSALTRGSSIAVPVPNKQLNEIGAGDIPELFIIGDTHTYNASFLPIEVTKFLSNMLDSSPDVMDNHYPLHCGVYCAQGTKPVVAAYATAFYNYHDKKTLYISLSVYAAEGHENDPTVIGIQRIVVFADGLQVNILHRLLDITDEDPDVSVTRRKAEQAALLAAKEKERNDAIIAALAAERAKQAEMQRQLDAERERTHDDRGSLEGRPVSGRNQSILSTEQSIYCNLSFVFVS